MRPFRTAAVAALALLLFVGPLAPAALAEEDHGGGINTHELFWKGLNFAILIGAIAYVLKAPVAKAFLDRRKGIEDRLAEAERARDEALAKLCEAEARLARADAEVAEILQNATSDAAADREQMTKAADVEAERIKAFADEEIRRAVTAARAELRTFVAEIATNRAIEILAREMQDADRKRLADDYIRHIGGTLPS
ncbi:MAG: ATP synthase F0 subunit B [Acidobacteriota bacterium]